MYKYKHKYINLRVHIPANNFVFKSTTLCSGTMMILMKQKSSTSEGLEKKRKSEFELFFPDTAGLASSLLRPTQGTGRSIPDFTRRSTTCTTSGSSSSSAFRWQLSCLTVNQGISICIFESAQKCPSSSN